MNFTVHNLYTKQRFKKLRNCKLLLVRLLSCGIERNYCNMENDFSNEKYFRCGQCMYKTVRKHNLKRHMLKMHTESKRILECCGLVFQTKAVLREHMTRFHENGYMCLICRRLFQRKALLTRHLTVHGGRKEFHCSVCTYETSHKSNLQRHQKVHRKKLTAHVKEHKSSDKTSGLGFSAYQGDCITCEIGKISEYANFGNRQRYSTYPLYGDIPPNSSCAKETGLFYNEKKSPLTAMAELPIPQQSFWGCYARHFQYEKHSYFNSYVKMMVTSNQVRPFYGNEASCLRYRPEPGQTDKLIEFEKRSSVKGHKDVKLVKNDDGEEMESSSSASMKPPRLCHYPYKCNFCSCRFGSQHELCHHNTVCTF